MVAVAVAAACTAAEPYRSAQAPAGVDGGSTGSGGGGIIDGTGGSGGVEPEDAGNSDDGPVPVGTGGTGGQMPPMDAGGGTGGMGTGGAGTGGAGTGGAGTGGAGTGGANGTGGTPAVDGCAHANWTFAASTICDTADCAGIAAMLKDPANAIDGNVATRYSSGRAQGSAGQENVVLTFPHTVTLAGIHLFTSSAGDGPASYRVEYATTGTNFAAFNPAVTGTGADDLMIKFPATMMKAFRITQIGTKTPSWWSIHELTLIGCAN